VESEPQANVVFAFSGQIYYTVGIQAGMETFVLLDTVLKIDVGREKVVSYGCISRWRWARTRILKKPL
jgi:hypothetical protein